jgi:hypothetical protein
MLKGQDVPTFTIAGENEKNNTAIRARRTKK